MCFLKLGKIQQAERHLKNLMKEAPRDKMVVKMWMLFLGGQQRWVEAVAAYRDYANLASDDRGGIINATDRIRLYVGNDLISMCDLLQGSTIISDLREMRYQLLQESEFLVPPIRIMDDPRLDARRYTLYIEVKSIYIGEIFTPFAIVGRRYGAAYRQSIEPCYEDPISWISTEAASEIKNSGQCVLSCSDVLLENIKALLMKNRELVWSLRDSRQEM